MLSVYVIAKNGVELIQGSNNKPILAKGSMVFLDKQEKTNFFNDEKTRNSYSLIQNAIVLHKNEKGLVEVTGRETLYVPDGKFCRCFHEFKYKKELKTAYKNQLKGEDKNEDAAELANFVKVNYNLENSIRDSKPLNSKAGYFAVVSGFFVACIVGAMIGMREKYNPNDPAVVIPIAVLGSIAGLFAVIFAITFFYEQHNFTPSEQRPKFNLNSSSVERELNNDKSI
ncbi:MAG: hypothetical protein HRK26_03780 [Rickettsiaceae bacterium H1]|nr:hypothetical protein [Rickettsiaceae bacterium H1]